MQTPVRVGCVDVNDWWLKDLRIDSLRWIWVVMALLLRRDSWSGVTTASGIEILQVQGVSLTQLVELIRTSNLVGGAFHMDGLVSQSEVRELLWQWWRVSTPTIDKQLKTSRRPTEKATTEMLGDLAVLFIFGNCLWISQLL